MTEKLTQAPNLFRPGLWWRSTCLLLLVCMASFPVRDWLGTEQTHFLEQSGWRIHSFQRASTPNAYVYDVTALGVTPDRKLWVGTQDGLYAFDDKVWESYWTGSGRYHGSSVYGLVTDGAGRIWVSSDRGLDRISNGLLGKVRGFPPPAVLAVDNEGKVWQASSLSNRVILAPLQKSSRNLPRAETRLGISALAFGPDDRVWIGTNEGIKVFDGQQWLDYGPVTDVDISIIAFDSQGRAWVSGEKDWKFEKSKLIIPKQCSLAVFDSQTSEQYRIPIPNSEDVSGVSALAFDSQDRLWAAFDARYRKDLSFSLGMYDGSNWSFFQTSDAIDPISSDSASSSALVIDDEGRLWVGLGSLILSLDTQTDVLETNPVPGVVWHGRKLGHWLGWSSAILATVTVLLGAWTTYLQTERGQTWTRTLRARSGDVIPTRRTLGWWLIVALRLFATGICLFTLTTFRGLAPLAIEAVVDATYGVYLIAVPISAVLVLISGAVDIHRRRTPTQLGLGILSILIGVATVLYILFFLFLYSIG